MILLIYISDACISVAVTCVRVFYEFEQYIEGLACEEILSTEYSAENI